MADQSKCCEHDEGAHQNECGEEDQHQKSETQGQDMQIEDDELGDEDFEDTDDPEELRKIYDKWSANYDQDLAKMNYNGPKQVAEALSKLVSNKDASILDLGCCTGIVGEELHKVGYRNIDGIDISEESIKIAKGKNVYRNIFNEILNPEKDSSFETGCYDVVILVGGGMFLDIKNLKDWLRITKPDGYVVIAIMKGEFDQEKYAVQSTIDEYVKEGLIKHVTKEVMEDFIMGKAGATVYLQSAGTSS
ncbi:methyltransferase-like protein 27 [Glandiceps talaboti]